MTRKKKTNTSGVGRSSSRFRTEKPQTTLDVAPYVLVQLPPVWKTIPWVLVFLAWLALPEQGRVQLAGELVHLVADLIKSKLI